MDAENNSIAPKKPPLLWSCRLNLVLLSFFGVFLLFLMRFNLSMGIVCMADSGDIMWDKPTQGAVLSAFFYGYFCTQILGGWISDRFGGKLALLTGIGLLSSTSILIPLFARMSSTYVIVIRVIQGLVSGLAFPSVYNLFRVWTGLEERATLMSVVFSAVAGATVVNFPLASLLCKSGLDGGWPMVFYVPGAIGLLWCLAFQLLAFGHPDKHPRITLNELKYLAFASSDGDKTDTDREFDVPWKSMLTSLNVHALWITHVAFSWCFYLTAVNIPLLAKEVFKMGVVENGLMSALPYVGMMVMSTTGKLFDFLRRKNLTTLTNLRKGFNTVAFLVPAASMFSLRFLSADDSAGAITLLTLAMSFLQVSTTGGFYLSHSELAGKYSGILFGFTNTMAQIPGFVNALLVAYLTPNKTREEWLGLYDIAASMSLIGAFIYMAFGSSELQSWAKSDNQNKEPDAAANTISKKNNSNNNVIQEQPGSNRGP